MLLIIEYDYLSTGKKTLIQSPNYGNVYNNNKIIMWISKVVFKEHRFTRYLSHYTKEDFKLVLL